MLEFWVCKFLGMLHCSCSNSANRLVVSADVDDGQYASFNNSPPVTVHSDMWDRGNYWLVSCFRINMTRLRILVLVAETPCFSSKCFVKEGRWLHSVGAYGSMKSCAPNATSEHENRKRKSASARYYPVWYARIEKSWSIKHRPTCMSFNIGKYYVSMKYTDQPHW